MGALALTSQPIGKLATLHARALSSESSEEASSHRERPPFTSRLDLLKLRRPAIDETDETRGRGAKTAVVSSRLQLRRRGAEACWRLRDVHER